MTDFSSSLRSRPLSTRMQDELRADGPVEQRRHDRRIDAARQSADHAVVADRRRMSLDRLLGKIAQPPGAVAVADVGEKVGQHLLPSGVCVTSG